MAHHCPNGSEGFVVEGEFEPAGGNVGSERATDLYNPHRPAAGAAPADVVYELGEREAKGRLEDATVLYVAGELENLGSSRPSHAELTESPGPIGNNRGTAARDKTLLTTVGLPKSPAIAGSGGLARSCRGGPPGSRAWRSPRRICKRRHRPAGRGQRPGCCRAQRTEPAVQVGDVYRRRHGGDASGYSERT